ncbi:MAG: aminotransferase class I/II-fold pyridoxal phosphate-dependent enzyme [Rickettsiales bacterium]|nr:aminotransferase class I/II-fold pyridoxal phosphate-dependent enzyme [Rickettsiales bacterium]
MPRKQDLQNTSLQTKLVRAGAARSEFGETSEAIFLNSGFCYSNAETAESRFNGVEPGFVYSRYSNPSLRMLEERLTALEKNAEECCVVASGMAAVFASIMCDFKPGDHIVANKVLFGSCHYIINNILVRLGGKVTLVNGENIDEWKAAINEKTTHIFVETPANPSLGLTDIAEVAKLSKKVGARFIVDNIFAGPIIQSPLELGADVTVYSTTKHMDGHGRTLGGAVLGSQKFITETLVPFHRHTGPALSPFNAWIVLKALETYKLRLEKHCENAQKLAEFLEGHKNIERVFYPGLKSHPQYSIAQKQMKNGGPMIAFKVKGGKAETFKLLNNLKIIDISNNLGDAKSLITHPATTTHSNIPEAERNLIGITENMLRLSVGLEDVDDLIRDIELALEN